MAQQQQQNQDRTSPDLTRFDEDKESEMYTIISSYQPEYSDELKLEAGEQVQVFSKEFRHSGNLGWWTGKTNNGQVGIFPASLVRRMNDAPCRYVDSTQETEPLAIPFSELTLHEVVGVGGFGMVYRAEWRDKEVAVKIAKHATVEESTKILEEAKKFAVLSHPNICSLLCTCTNPPTMVIQYAAGGNLSDVLHKEKIQLNTSTIVNWASQIASGMEYLHEGLRQPLIHRDLKSCNILLEHRIDPENLAANNLLISDFGLAHEIQHTTRLSGAGTYAWMAPEALMSTVSKGSDVWSYGVVIWELLTGEIPYKGLEGVAIAFGIGTFTLSLPIPEDCPVAFKELLTDCWKQDSHQRPSFVAILDRLSNVTSEFLSTPPETFQSIRMNWKEEVQRKFLEFKDKELALQAQQKALEDLRTMVKQREEKLQEKERELLKREQEVNEKIARMTSVEESKDSPTANITPRQQPSPPVMISLMKRLWSFGRKEKNKSKTSPHVSPRGSIKKRRESTKSVTSSTSSGHASIFTRDRSNSDAPQLSLEYCEKNLASLTTDDSLRERLSFDTKKLTSKKKNSLDIPLQPMSLTKSNSFGSITPTHRRPGDLSFNRQGKSYLSPTTSLPPTKGLAISSSSLERDSGKESAGPDTPHSCLMQFDSPVKIPARPLSVDDLFKLSGDNFAESPFSTTSIDSAYIGAFHNVASSGNASPCPPPTSPTSSKYPIIPRPKPGPKIAKLDLIPCPPGFIRNSSVEGTPNYSLSPCSSRSVSPCTSRKPSNSDCSPCGPDHPLNGPVPPYLDQPLITSTPQIETARDLKFLFDQVHCSNNNTPLV